MEEAPGYIDPAVKKVVFGVEANVRSVHLEKISAESSAAAGEVLTRLQKYKVISAPKEFNGHDHAIAVLECIRTMFSKKSSDTNFSRMKDKYKILADKTNYFLDCIEPALLNASGLIDYVYEGYVPTFCRLPMIKDIIDFLGGPQTVTDRLKNGIDQAEYFIQTPDDEKFESDLENLLSEISRDRDYGKIILDAFITLANKRKYTVVFTKSNTISYAFHDEKNKIINIFVSQKDCPEQPLGLDGALITLDKSSILLHELGHGILYLLGCSMDKFMTPLTAIRDSHPLLKVIVPPEEVDVSAKLLEHITLGLIVATIRDNLDDDIGFGNIVDDVRAYLIDGSSGGSEKDKIINAIWNPLKENLMFYISVQDRCIADLDTVKKLAAENGHNFFHGLAYIACCTQWSSIGEVFQVLGVMPYGTNSVLENMSFCDHARMGRTKYSSRNICYDPAMWSTVSKDLLPSFKVYDVVNKVIRTEVGKVILAERQNAQKDAEIAAMRSELADMQTALERAEAEGEKMDAVIKDLQASLAAL
ncbi:hypothetical protein FACS189449_05450 [Alphaproteobacteria bacterium]|nr:hypothetical protein FACS189449_05450 [Alphaproteobacteria bacterium]